MSKKITFILILAIFVSPVIALNWEVLEESKDSQILIDSSGISKKNNEVTFMIKVIPASKEKMKIDGKNQIVDSYLKQYKIFCTDQTYRKLNESLVSDASEVIIGKKLLGDPLPITKGYIKTVFDKYCK